jgi:hypothetical protein
MTRTYQRLAPRIRASADRRSHNADPAGLPCPSSIEQRTRCSPWRPGAHELIVDALLEDLAGNSLARVFDRDLTRLTDDPLDICQTTVTFRC